MLSQWAGGSHGCCSGGHSNIESAPARLRRVRARGLLLYMVAAALTIAGAVAIAALLQGSLSTDHLRVLGTSLGFAIFSATWAAGAAAQREGCGPAAVVVGFLTALFSAISLVTLSLVIWASEYDSWRTFGTVALLTLAGSHASIVLRARRPSDGAAIRLLAGASILLAALDCGAGALAFLEVLRIQDYESSGKAAAAVLIAMLVTTALQPIMRAAARTRARGAPPVASGYAAAPGSAVATHAGAVAAPGAAA